MKIRKSSPLLSGVMCAFLAVGLLAPALVRAHPGIEQQIRDLTSRIGDSPTDASLLLRRAELYRLHRDWPAAETDLQRAAKLDPALAEVLLQLGELQLDAGKSQEAKRTLDEFLRRRPNDGRGHAARARAEVRLGQHLAAAGDWTRAIDAAANGLAGPGYYLERARALAAAGPQHLDAALRGLDKGLAALGEPVTLQLYAIDLEVQRERWDAALARLERIAARSPRKETWLLRRGEILENAGRPRDARAAYLATLTALDTLPPGRRQSRAMQRVAGAARDGATRLEPDGS